MAARKVPVKKKYDPYEGLPKICWDSVTKGDMIGSGSFGNVTKAQYIKDGIIKNIVLKEPNNVSNFEKEFIKEAKLLFHIGSYGHENIVKLEGVSNKPYAIMQEYCCFDFFFFDDDTVSQSLMSFLSHVDLYYDYGGFQHLPEMLIKDIYEGLKFLHNNNIVHRDLKPANILVSNCHYVNKTKDEALNHWVKDDKPVVCKLTDFGESRSNIIQTMTVIKSKTVDIDRGTPAYNSPEILTLTIFPAAPTSLGGLMIADYWAFGMVVYMILNPQPGHPFKNEIDMEVRKFSNKTAKEVLKDLLRKKINPSYLEKYEKFHSGNWIDFVKFQKQLNEFNFDKRLKSLDDIERVFVRFTKSKEVNGNIENQSNATYGKETVIDANTSQVELTYEAGDRLIVCDDSGSKSDDKESGKNINKEKSNDVNEIVVTTENQCHKKDVILLEDSSDSARIQIVNLTTANAVNSSLVANLVSSSSSIDVSSSEASESDEDLPDLSTVLKDKSLLKPVGTFYKNKVTLPIFSWSIEPYDCRDIVEILLNDFDESYLCTSQPINVAHNVSFLVNTALLKRKDDLYCDDMGSWKHKGTPSKSFGITSDKLMVTCSSKNDTVPQLVLRRQYYRNKASPDVRKIISSIKKKDGAMKHIYLVQYLFENEHEVKSIPHGNSKSKTPYYRLKPSVVEEMKLSVKSKKNPNKVLDQLYTQAGDVCNAESLGSIPCGPQDLYNARRSAKEAPCGGGTSSSSVKIDALWMLLGKAKSDEAAFKDNKFIRECRMHPDFLTVLADERQLKELELFCTNASEFCVFGADPTFNLFEDNISLTVTTYRNLKLINKETGLCPVFLGPMLMHQNKEWKSYSHFAHTLVTEHPVLNGILACGTYGEKALIEGFSRHFRYAIMLQCSIHVKKNIEKQLIERHVKGKNKNDTISEIFGKQDGETKFQGLVDAESGDDFDEKLEKLKSLWNNRESNNENMKMSFFDWFTKYKATTIKEALLKPVRIEAGLGNPPNEFTTNDTEAGNFLVKYDLNFAIQKPHEFIENLKNLIDKQFRNRDRAVFGKSQYRIRPCFKQFEVSDHEWGKLTSQQRTGKLLSFNKATMSDKHMPIYDIEPSLENKRLTIDLAVINITTIPQPVLQKMCRGAELLLNGDNLVIPKPGATDHSFIVAGKSNITHSVTLGKGGSLSCDNQCSNKTSRICDHVLAVAAKVGRIKEFVAWFKRSKHGANLQAMVLSGGAKNVGQKKNTRKRSNKVKEPVTSYKSIFSTTANNITIPVSINQLSESLASFTSSQSSQSRVPKPVFKQPSNIPIFDNSFQSINTPVKSNFSNIFSDFNICSSTQLNAVPFQSTPLNPVTFPSMPLNSVPFPSTPINLGPFSSMMQADSLSCNPPATNTLFDSSFASQNIVLPANQILPSHSPMRAFCLKWVSGTKVSKYYGCYGYGCNDNIANPPRVKEEDLIIVYRDFRQYRNQAGQLTVTPDVQNIHFHLNTNCVRKRYPNFSGINVVVPNDFMPLLMQEHVDCIRNQIGVTL